MCVCVLYLGRPALKTWRLKPSLGRLMQKWSVESQKAWRQIGRGVTASRRRRTKNEEAKSEAKRRGQTEVLLAGADVDEEGRDERDDVQLRALEQLIELPAHGGQRVGDHAHVPRVREVAVFGLASQRLAHGTHTPHTPHTHKVSKECGPERDLAARTCRKSP